MVHALHVVAGLDAAHGGPSYSIPKLCRTLAEIGAEIDLYSVKGQDPRCNGEIGDNYRERYFDWDYIRVPVLRNLRWSSDLSAALRAATTHAEIIHDHGIWLLPNVQAGRAAARSHTPLIVSPRGMLAPTALAFKPLEARVDVYTNCDAAIARLPRLACDTPHPNWLLTTSILASRLALIDVSVGLPAMGGAFNGARPISSGSSTPTFYPYGALLLLGGAIGDRYGKCSSVRSEPGIIAVASMRFGVKSMRQPVIHGERRDRREFERPRLHPRRRPLPLA